MIDRLGGVREVSWTLILSDVGFASVTLPREEEEPRVTTYAAAEMEGIAGQGFQTERTTVVGRWWTSAGGGRVLRICRCLEADAV
jgi:hypothetical protein